MIEITGAVPIKRYLYKFTLRNENLNDGDVLNLNHAGLIGFTLKLFLTGKTNIDHNAPAKIPDDVELLRFKIGARLSSLKWFFLSKKGNQQFNTFLYKMFHEELLRKIIEGVMEGKDQKDVILEFIEYYDIFEDIDYDALKKANQRLRKVKKIDLYQLQNSY